MKGANKTVSKKLHLKKKSILLKIRSKIKTTKHWRIKNSNNLIVQFIASNEQLDIYQQFTSSS